MECSGSDEPTLQDTLRISAFSLGTLLSGRANQHELAFQVMRDTWPSHPITSAYSQPTTSMCVKSLQRTHQLIADARLSPAEVSQAWFRSAQLTRGLVSSNKCLLL